MGINTSYTLGKISLLIAAGAAFIAANQFCYTQDNTTDWTQPSNTSGFEAYLEAISPEELVIDSETTHKNTSPVIQSISNEDFETEELAEDHSYLENPFEITLDIETIESLIIGTEDSEEKTSELIDEIPYGTPYRGQKYRDEQAIKKEHPFPKLNKPNTIQSEIQEDAEEQGY